MNAITQEQPDKPCVAHANNFETLRRAFAAGDVALMEVQIVATGERVACICAVEKTYGEPKAITDTTRTGRTRTRVGQELEQCNFVPFALMLNGNPYELLSPPLPEGGFAPAEQSESEAQANATLATPDDWTDGTDAVGRVKP